MKILTTLLLTIWLILPLTAFELVTTETERRVVDDAGAVVATYPLPDRTYFDLWSKAHFEPWDKEVWDSLSIITSPDWWAVFHKVNGQTLEPIPPAWAWQFISHELHIAGESWELPESFIDSVEVGPSTVTAIVRKFSEQAKWQDHEQTTYVFNRKFPDPEPEPLQLIVSADPAIGGASSGAGVYDYRTEATIHATAAEGYRFVTWEGERITDRTSATTTVEMRSDQTVTAQFIKVWDLAVAPLDSGSGTVSSGGSYDHGSEATIHANAAEGYRFMVWQGESLIEPTSATTTVEMISDRSVIAQFIKVWDLIAFSDPVIGGMVNRTRIHDHGSHAAISAVAAEGYRFKSWLGEVEDPTSATTTVAMTSDRIVTAQFAEAAAVWELALSAHPGDGSGRVSSGGSYENDSEISINAVPAEGYRFVIWLGEGIADPTSAMTTVAMTSDRALTAQFLKVWELTAQSVPPAGGTVSGVGVYDKGRQVTIKAVATEGYEFQSWLGEVDDPTSATTTVAMTSHQLVAAQFVLVDPDRDKDGIEDAWEVRFGLNPNDPWDAELDIDGDGQSALAEFFAQTDPTSAASSLRIGAVRLSQDGEKVVIDWPSVLGITYSIQSTEAPESGWTNNAIVEGFGGLQSYALELSESTGSTLVRVTVVRPIEL